MLAEMKEFDWEIAPEYTQFDWSVARGICPALFQTRHPTRSYRYDACISYNSLQFMWCGRSALALLQKISYAMIPSDLSPKNGLQC